jgi:CRISPR system Cascade subunit CasB
VKNTIYSDTSHIIYQIASNLESSSSKAYLAQLRQSVGRDIYTATGVFPLIFSSISDTHLGTGGKLTDGERAIITTLQLYALHQQGKSFNVNIMNTTDKEENKTQWDRGRNLGAVLNSLRTEESSKSVDRRFNAMITADSFDELTIHLRHLIKLLKSRSETRINYPQLAVDLYFYQKGFADNLRLKWSRSYYRRVNNEKGDKENE